MTNPQDGKILGPSICPWKKDDRVCGCLFSHFQLWTTLWTAAHQDGKSHVSSIGRWVLYHWRHLGSPKEGWGPQPGTSAFDSMRPTNEIFILLIQIVELFITVDYLHTQQYTSLPYWVCLMESGINILASCDEKCANKVKWFWSCVLPNWLGEIGHTHSVLQWIETLTLSHRNNSY